MEESKSTRTRTVFGRLKREIGGKNLILEMTQLGLSVREIGQRGDPEIIPFEEMVNAAMAKSRTREISGREVTFEINDFGVIMSDPNFQKPQNLLFTDLHVKAVDQDKQMELC